MPPLSSGSQPLRCEGTLDRQQGELGWGGIPALASCSIQWLRSGGEASKYLPSRGSLPVLKTLQSPLAMRKPWEVSLWLASHGAWAFHGSWLLGHHDGRPPLGLPLLDHRGAGPWRASHLLGSYGLEESMALGRKAWLLEESTALGGEHGSWEESMAA
jgi:hypothetical protein